MKQTRGGKREGSGRPKNDNKAYSVQCIPERIKDVREFAKILSKLNEGRELDNTPFTIENAPESLIAFWHKYFKENGSNAQY